MIIIKGDIHMSQTHELTTLNIKLYRIISQDIICDKVIITEERIQHIKDRHPDDYERFMQYIPEIFTNPLPSLILKIRIGKIFEVKSASSYAAYLRNGQKRCWQ